MASLGAWIRISKDSGAQPLRDFATSQKDWPPDTDDFGKYADFIIKNEPDEGKRSQLLSELASENSAWKSPQKEWWQLLMENIGELLLAVFGIVVAVILIVGIFSNDNAFIKVIGEPEKARGLITFLFSFTLIALFLLVGITTFWMEKPDVAERFTKAKDLLALMIGIFGTILGFYYGSLANASGGGQALSLTNFGTPTPIVQPGVKTTIGATVSGGKQPVLFDISFTDQTGKTVDGLADVKDKPVADDKIAQEITIPATPKPPWTLIYKMTVHDAGGAKTVALGAVPVESSKPAEPAPGGQPQQQPSAPNAQSQPGEASSTSQPAQPGQSDQKK